MILLDTNVILRHIIKAEDERTKELARISTALMKEIQAGSAEAVVPEIVVHEVCYILGSKKHYNLDSRTVQSLVTPFLKLRGLKIPESERRIYVRAVEIYGDDQKLGIADALVLARCERAGHLLASHDRRMNRFPSVKRWNPANSTEQSDN